MESTSAIKLAQEILDSCLAYGTWPGKALDALIERALDEDDEFQSRSATRALFGVLIERLGDLFEPTLCDTYARLFSHVISRTLPEYDAEDLQVRYRRVRQVKRFAGGQVDRVFVLSRVTLGADVAVTSVALAAAKERFPGAEIVLVGPEKNAELFAADPSIKPAAVMYGRSSVLRERLLAAAELQVALDEPSSIVIDPDSRLTQLGLIPVCDESRYYFFESRSFGGNGSATLSSLTSEWTSEVFDISPPRPFAAPLPQSDSVSITLSWGTGDNEAKSLGPEFQFEVTKALTRLNVPILIDRGAGGGEAQAVDELSVAIGRPDLIRLHTGSYASFASYIQQSRLYVGYDSAGQHVAAASGIPLVSVFAGYACERMFQRWRPDTSRSWVIQVDGDTRTSALDRTLHAIAAATA